MARSVRPTIVKLGKPNFSVGLLLLLSSLQSRHTSPARPMAPPEI
jgi:hypothetical protein